MSIEQMKNIESQDPIDPRIEEILTYYDPSIKEAALNEWQGYSEAERDRLYLEFMKDHKKESD